MSLRMKLFSMLLTVVAVFAAIGFLIQYKVIYPSYLKLEHDEAVKNMARCVEAIYREVQYLDTFNMDWAAWDDSYRFIVDKNEDYISSSLDITTYVNNSINLIHYYNTAGELVWGKAFDIEKRSEMVIPEFSQSKLPPSHRWLNHKLVSDSVAGIIPTQKGPLIFSSRPIITTSNKGPIRGTLIMGRFFNDAVVKKLTNITRVQFESIFLAKHQPDQAIQAILGRLEDANSVYTENINKKKLCAYRKIYDIDGKPVLLLRAVFDRDISQAGAGTLWYAQSWILCAAIIMLVILIFAMQRTIVNPILSLIRHASQIHQTNDLSMRLGLNRKDAIGDLAREFDHMVLQLEMIHNDLESRVAARTAELKHANELLEVQISERRQVGRMLLAATKEIDEKNSQLQEANDQLNLSIQRVNKLAQRAEAANAAKSLFLNNIGHEFRTPMNGIIGNASLLKETPLNPDQEIYLDAVIRSSRKLLSLINDLLDFTNMETGQLELTAIDFNIRGVLDEVVGEFAQRAHRKKIGIACLIHHDVPFRVNGDPGRLKQILANLVDNAIKFSDQGEVLILVGIEAETDRNLTLRFAVTDTGIGISASRMDRLFDFFSQVDASSTRRYEGTGIGLAISRHLARHMKGDMGVESKEGDGSTFWFTVLLDKAPCVDDEGCFLSKDLGGLRVLIVDSVEINRRVFKEQLQLFGCEFEEVDNGEDALKMAQQAFESERPFDVALINQTMEVLNGEETGMMIKADPFLQDLDLVLLANIGSRGDAGRYRTLGFSAYLTKPIKHGELCDCLKRIAQKKNERPQSSSREIITRHSLSEAKRFETVKRLSFYNDVRRLVADLTNRFELHTTEAWGDEILRLEQVAEAIGAETIRLALQKLAADLNEASAGPDGSESIDQLDRAVKSELQSRAPESEKSELAFNYSQELSIPPTQIIPILKHFADALELADPFKVKAQLELLKEFIDSTTLEELKEKIDDYEYQDAKQTVESLLKTIHRESE